MPKSIINFKGENILNINYQLVPQPTDNEIVDYYKKNESPLAEEKESQNFLTQPTQNKFIQLLQTFSKKFNTTYCIIISLLLTVLNLYIGGWWVANKNTITIIAANTIATVIMVSMLKADNKILSKVAAAIGIIVMGVMIPTGANGILFAFLIAATAIIQHSHEDIYENSKKYNRLKKFNNMATVEQALVPVWGKAGAHIGSNNKFDEKSTKLGLEGEIILGESLEKWAKKYAHVRVFHGLCFTPNKPGADIDHAVLIGDNVVLIDAKNWWVASYAWQLNSNNQLAVTRNGVFWKGSNVNMFAAVDKWTNYMRISGDNVTSIIVPVQPESKGKKYSVDNSNSPYNVKVGTIPELLEYLDSLVKQNDEKLDRYLISKIASQLQ